MAAADYRLMTEATGQRIAAALEALSGTGAAAAAARTNLDVYSKGETDNAIAQSTAAMPLIEIGQVTVTTGTTKGALGYGGTADITFAKVHKSIPKVFTNIYDVASYWTSTCSSVTINGARISIAGNLQNTSKTVFWVAISF